MKSFISTLVLGACVLFCSCQKEYQCVCTNSNTGNVHHGDKMKAGPFTKAATEKTCENNDELSAGALKDCHLE
jgi:hypothetical protein